MTTIEDRSTATQPRVRRDSSVLWYGGAVAIGSALAIIGSLRQAFNQNELQQMATYASSDIGTIVGGTRQPPLDPLAGALVQHILGVGQWQGRLVPVLAGIGVLLVMSLLLIRLGLGRAGAFAVLILATSPLMTRYTAYTRPYALPLFFMVLFIYATQAWFDEGRRRWLGLSVVAAVALLLTRVPEPAVFLGTTAVVLAWFALRRRMEWKSAGPIVAICIGAVVCIGYPMYRSTATQASQYADNSFDLLSKIRPGLYHVRTTVVPLVAEWFPWWPFILLVVVAALALRESRRWLFDFWAWWPSLAGPVAWIFFYHFMTAFRLDQMPYRPRYLYFFLPSFVFLVAALGRALALRSKAPRGWRIALVALLGVALVGQLPATATVLREDEDPDFGLASEVLTAHVPEDAIVLFDNPNPPGRYRYPFLGYPRYMGERPRVLQVSGLWRKPETVPTTGPVYVMLLDRMVAATQFQNPEGTWRAEVQGWQSQRFGRFSLYSPTQGQAGRQGVLRAAREFGAALGPTVGYPEWWAAVGLLRAEGHVEQARELLDRMLAETPPADSQQVKRVTRRSGPHVARGSGDR